MKKILYVLVVGTVAGLVGCAGDRGKEKVYTVAFVPKIKGIPYFTACQKGAEEAGKELGIKVVYDGPTKADRNLQLDLLNNWIASGDYDSLAVACTDKEGVAPALRGPTFSAPPASIQAMLPPPAPTLGTSTIFMATRSSPTQL